MKNEDSRSRGLRFGGLWDRLLSVGVLLLFLYLVYLAVTGRFDAEVNRFAAWLRHLFQGH